MEIRRLAPNLSDALTDFFERLKQYEDIKYFQPHDLDVSSAKTVCDFKGRDIYVVALHQKSVVAYGMLRGWDEGFNIPSLGLAVDPGFRSIGIGKAMMYYLHCEARLEGASSVYLKVDIQNEQALRLYLTMGYKFSPKSTSQLEGLCAL